MEDLIQEARLFIEKNMGPAVLTGAPQRSSNYTKYTTDLYSYIPLPYYELHRIDGDSIFKNYPYPGKVLFYFHIPFCSYKCSFCYYYSLPRCRDDLVDRYLDCLKRELEMVNSRISLESLPVHSLHFGGGTPSYLNLRQLAFLFSAVKRIVKIDGKTCLAFETSPETIQDQDKLKFLFDSGVRHIDIGIQTFQDDALSFSNRRHTSETAVKAYNEAKKTGFEDINLDMMINLPGQTLKGWQGDLERLALLRPSSVTLHQTILKTNSMQELYSRDSSKFSHNLDILMMKVMAHIFLEENGYQLQKVDFYSLKHQDAGVTESIPEVLSFGVRSWSCFNSFEYYNAMDIYEYMKIIDKGKLPIVVGAKIQEDRKLRKLIMRDLKDTVNGLEINLWDKYKSLNNENLRQGENIERLRLTRIVKNRLKLNISGIFFVDEIFKEFYESRTKVALFVRIVLGNKLLRYLYFKISKSSPGFTSRFFLSLNTLSNNLRKSAMLLKVIISPKKEK